MCSALAMSDPGKAREVYGQMSESNKEHSSTKYLLYKAALSCQDRDLGAPLFLSAGSC